MAEVERQDGNEQEADPPETLTALFLVFLRLGLTSFGGPVAHLGYFRAEFVRRRRWLSEPAYAEVVGLCQFLPGPASSQVGFAIGLMRRGTLGGLAAWTGFTLPSALIMTLWAAGAGHLPASLWGVGLLHGLKLVAVAIVAQAVWGMARSLCPDPPRAGISVAALIIVTAMPLSWGQVTAILIGGAAGLALCRQSVPETPSLPVSSRVSERAGLCCLLVAVVLLLVLPMLGQHDGSPELFNAFYHAGALVFGGGHVVLPLLRDAVVGRGWLSDDAFLAGYGVAQALPGPLFSFAAYLGVARSVAPNGTLGAAIALFGIFLPGLLLVIGVLPFWGRLRDRRQVQASVRGINAAVVGLLAAALYDPVWTSAVLRPSDFAAAATGFVLLTALSTPPLVIVALGACTGLAQTYFG